MEQAFKESIAAHNLDAEVEVVSTGCMGPCSRGPMVTVQIQGAPDVIYENVTTDAARAILEEHVGQAQPV
ncbi:MAG: (2Fe-2S) ferredoxin domain-containing protein [Caldilineaceae bacterium]